MKGGVLSLDIGSSMRNLLQVFRVMKKVKNERHLLNILYISKELSGQPPFNFEFNDIGPFSYEADIALALLESYQLVRETEDNDSIYLTKKGEKVLTESKDFEIIKKLKNYDVEDIVNLSKLIYIRKRMKGANEIKINEKVKQAFFLSDEEIERAKKIYDSLIKRE